MITLRKINALSPCYDPQEIGFTPKMELTPLEFIEQFADKVQEKSDIIWLLCRKQFMSEKDLRLFAVWNAREALKLIDNPDERSVTAVDVAERFANGEASAEELEEAREDAEATTYAAEATTYAAAAAAADAAADTASYTTNSSAAAYAAAAADAAYAYANAADEAYAYYAYTYAYAAADAARVEFENKQIEKLKTYFND